LGGGGKANGTSTNRTKFETVRGQQKKAIFKQKEQNQKQGRQTLWAIALGITDRRENVDRSRCGIANESTTRAETTRNTQNKKTKPAPPHKKV